MGISNVFDEDEDEKKIEGEDPKKKK